MNSTWLRAGSALAFLGVALGAFGAHALKAMLGDNRAIWETGVQYQMFHALALIFLSIAKLPEKSAKWIGWLFFLGTVVFSGSLYALALTNIKVLGAITPLGGVCFLSGWAVLFCTTFGKRTAGAN